MTANNPSKYYPLSGGQFEPVSIGQFEPAKGGQFQPVGGGQLKPDFAPPFKCFTNVRFQRGK